MYITVKGNNGQTYDDYYHGKNVYFKLYDKMLENRDSSLN